MFRLIPIWVWAAVCAVAFAAGAASGWQVQGWRLGTQISSMKAAQATAVTVAVNGARLEEQTRFKGVLDAQAVANKRAQSARADADRARSELDGLRDTLRSTRGGVPGESAGACAVRADAGADVLAQCAGAITELAGKADRHASDALMLQQAWPVATPDPVSTPEGARDGNQKKP